MGRGRFGESDELIRAGKETGGVRRADLVASTSLSLVWQPAHENLDFPRGQYVAEELDGGEHALDLSIDALRAKVEQVSLRFLYSLPSRFCTVSLPLFPYHLSMIQS